VRIVELLSCLHASLPDGLPLKARGPVGLLRIAPLRSNRWWERSIELL